MSTSTSTSTTNNKTSPRQVQSISSTTVSETDTGQTKGMIRQSAIVNLSPSICGTLMRALPHSSSDIHHHGEQDTIVYAVSGRGKVVSLEDGDGGDGGKKEKETRLEPGDWALIPAYREHMEVNDGDEEVVWVIVRAPGGTPVVQNLEGWGKS